MNTYPLKRMSISEAKNKQFQLIDSITKYFHGKEILTNGDLGLSPGFGRPKATAQVEKVLADFFGSEDAVLIRGAGTGAIRNSLIATLNPEDTLILHKAPVYPTTETTLKYLNIEIKRVDFNLEEEIEEKLSDFKGVVYIQHSRQSISDYYDMEKLIKLIKKISDNAIIVVDDNYAILKTPKNSIEMGADISAFSMFKLKGPEGIGCVIGRKDIINRIREMNYSGGGQVQGFEAMEVLRALVHVPVSLAIQAETIEKVVNDINRDLPKGIKKAYTASAQSRTVLIEFDSPIAKEVLRIAPNFGAAPYPIGAESKYEIVPMFYRISGTFIKENPSLEDYMIRINPMDAGPHTVINILKKSMGELID